MSSFPLAGTAPHRWRRFVIAFLASALIGGTWALATPLMGSPDEPPHVVRAAAVVRGEVLDVARVGPPDVDVPRYIAYSYELPCMAGRAALSASCQRPIPEDGNETVRARTTADSNSPVYYYLVGLPSLLPADGSVFYLMRLMNVLLCSALFGFAFLALADLSRRTWTTVALAVAATPMAFFLIGSVNPNGVELAASLAMLLTLVVALRAPGDRRLAIERAGVIVLSAALLVSTRSVSVIWAAMIVVIAVVLARPAAVRRVLRTPVYLGAIVAAMVIGAVSGLWYVVAQRVGDDPGNFGIGQGFAYGFGLMVQRTFDYWKGWIGIFGWLDTESPSVVYILWSTATVMLIVVALLLARGRLRIALALALITGVLVPPIVQGLIMHAVGIIWQGRYVLALYAVVLIVAGLCLDARLRRGRLTGSVVRITVAALAVAHLIAFVWSLRRFAVGDKTLIELVLRPEWHPPLGVFGVSALAAAAVGAAAIALIGSMDRDPALPPALRRLRPDRPDALSRPTG